MVKSRKNTGENDMRNQKTIPLRISDDLLEKLFYVAKSEGRTLNNEFLLLARNSVAYFERTKGHITPDKLATIREELEKEVGEKE